MELLITLLFVAIFKTDLISCGNVDQSQELFRLNSATFSTDLYSALLGNKPEGNVVVSPFSVQICGAMLYSGSAGKTAELMVQGFKLFQNNRTAVGKVFKTALEDHTENFLQIANKIYLANDFKVKPEFHEIIKEKFLSQEENVDFSESEKTAGIINSWVKNATHGKINKLFENDSFNNDVFMALVNTIYFKGEWLVPFQTTEKGQFWTSDKENIEIDMMSQEDYYKMAEMAELNAKVLQLKYKDTDISMLILLPNKRNGLEEMEGKLSTINLIELQDKLGEDYVSLTIPKFQIEYTADLQEVLTKMGMGSLFQDADFSNIVEGTLTKVDKAVHKAFIQVTELGTEAGASTGLSISLYTLPEPFIVDHPFVFTIVSKSAVLFLGRYVG